MAIQRGSAREQLPGHASSTVPPTQTPSAALLDHSNPHHQAAVVRFPISPGTGATRAQRLALKPRQIRHLGEHRGRPTAPASPTYQAGVAPLATARPMRAVATPQHQAAPSITRARRRLGAHRR